MMQFELVTSDNELSAFCQQASRAQAIAVDTEFVRTRTLYPILGLIQLYDGQSLVLVDPQKITDFEPLRELLINPSVVKVLHSCSEDLETFWHSLNVIPTPIFDSQFAACILNMGPTLGYANLVDTMLSIKLDKGESRTDWTARPLSPEQCRYAANDVLYLWQLYPELKKQVEQANRLEWVYQEIAQLAVKKQSVLPADLAYLGIKNNWQCHGRALYLLKQLAKWRLEQARERDMALNFVVRESNLLEIAKHRPKNKGALFAINGMTPQEARIHGETLLEIVESTADVPPELYPPAVERLIEYPGYKKIAADIRTLCIETAQEQNFPVEILGSKKQINQLLKWLWFDLDENKVVGIKPDLINGWRKPLLLKGIEDITGIKLEETN